MRVISRCFVGVNIAIPRSLAQLLYRTLGALSSLSPAAQCHLARTATWVHARPEQNWTSIDVEERRRFGSWRRGHSLAAHITAFGDHVHHSLHKCKAHLDIYTITQTSLIWHAGCHQHIASATEHQDTQIFLGAIRCTLTAVSTAKGCIQHSIHCSRRLL